jgi:hypothetical protein
MKRWPPLIWLLISAASLLVLVGVGGDYNPGALFPGIALALVGLGLALYLAYGGRHGPRPKGLTWMVPAVAAWYVVNAIAAAIAGGKYVIAALGASIIPLTAAALLIASVRTKTAQGTSHQDPAPGIPLDDETPLGDTTEHSDAERVAKPDPRFERRTGSRLQR